MILTVYMQEAKLKRIFKDRELTRAHLIGIILKWIHSGYEALLLQKESQERTTKLKVAFKEMRRLAAIMPKKKRGTKRKSVVAQSAEKLPKKKARRK